MIFLFYPITLFPYNRIFDWPLKINNGYSSSFQEFRPGHFHGGIDLRTFQKTGYTVHAVQEGHIYKIRYVKRGSGKGIYVKHGNGLSSIYFHLRNFTDPVEKIVRKLQNIKGKKYIGNYILQKPIHVRKGELIGYSGETGSGFPHLHLEIRDEENALVNPFGLINFRSKDKNFPVLRKLLIRSVKNSGINGRVGEFGYSFVKKDGPNFEIPENIYINGECEFILNTFDISDSGKFVAPSRIEFFLNGEKIYNIEFTRFTYDDNNQLGFVYDMFFSSSSSYFFNLFNQKGFVMSKESKTSESIYKLTKPGINNFKVKVYDNFNNVTSGRFSVYRSSDPVINIESSGLSDSSPCLRITEFHPGTSSKVVLSLFDKNDTKIFNKEFKIEEIIKEGVLKIPGSFKDQYLFAEFNFYNNDRLIFKKCFSYNNYNLDLITDLEIDKFINRNSVTIRIKDRHIASNNIILEVIQGSDRVSVFPQNDSEGIFFNFNPLNFKNEVKMNFSIFNNRKLTAQVQKKINLIIISDGKEQSIKFNDFKISFAKRSVREDKVILVENVSYPSSYPVISPQYRVYPHTFPFLDTVHIKFKSIEKNPEQIGIFKYSLKSKKWYYVTTSVKKREGLFISRLLTTGIFSLMRDIYKPEIYFKRPRRLTSNNLNKFKIIITDKGKGVNDDKIKALLNGIPVISEYDPDWKTLDIENFSVKVKNGWNKLEVNLEDRAGNYSSKVTSFKVEKIDRK
ncbi:MAG: M23 family metallopeptidase [Candidatus Aminicenantes bacterium]|nr:M23 family metallopeptidase [Candidatus Aminicenantes bacterium]